MQSGTSALGLSRFLRIAKKLLSHRLAECFFPNLQAHSIHRFCICASNIAKLVFSVRGSLIHYLGDLLRRRVRRHLLGIGDDAHNFVYEGVIRWMPTSIEGSGEEI